MIILLYMLSLAVAEPPVGEKHFEAAPSRYNLSPHQQYLPLDINFPLARSSTSFNGISNQYLPPSSRSISQEYGLPNTREGLSQNYGLPSTITSIFRNSIPQKYGKPITRSSERNSPNSESYQSFSSASLNMGVSQRYDTPSSRNFLNPSSLYGSPSLRSSPSSKYGAPQFRSSSEYTEQDFPVKNSVSNFQGSKSQSRSVSHEYGTSMNSDGLSLRSQSLDNLSQTYGESARSLTTQYGTPSAKSTDTGFGISTGPLKTTYEVQSGRNHDRDHRTYGNSNFRKLNSNTNAFSSSYLSSRTPIQKYGAPSSRAKILSKEYGPPESSLDDQGYEYARNALELLNQEPANYEFAYKVGDDDTGSDFGHAESRQLNRAEGAYFVLLPDGTKQVVEYEADDDGFKPRISVEPAESPTALASEGPY